ncbi:MAG TPA: type III secretion system cytoplasmic ring protein SctQ, partial [Magnetospirillum sp.]|nr:type III secretion system cytoplasmic ring protein SctQ [Magnetospirillum sp.]
LVGCDDLPPERLGRHRVDLRLRRRDGARVVHGSLFADARGLAVVAELAGRLPAPQPGGDGEWAALPIRLRLDAGWTDLPLSDLRGLARGDIVLLDATMLHEGGGLIVRVDESTALKARLVGTALVIDDIVRTIMTEDPAHSATVQEPPAADGAAEPLLASLESVNIRLTFDLGHRNLSLGELKALAPGATFDLGRAPAQAVNVRANGALIGTGELISVADRIGVRIAVLSGLSE